ncbi:hypothetical protein I4U23_012750 [Adineta vaga]|nr:hypothetical protein I4U23_012750 [Adineta vaga]
MSSLRVKVQFTEEILQYGRPKVETVLKFIYHLEAASSKTIGDLIKVLQDRINRELSTQHKQIVELVTGDDYVLTKSDICSNVLKDNDLIICVDLKKFAYDHFSTLDLAKSWLEIKEHDPSDNHEKTIQVGLSNIMKLYVRLRGTTNNYGLCLFDIHQLIDIATHKPKNTLIARIDNSDDYNETTDAEWFLESQWEYDANSNNQLFVICNMKVGSEDNVISKKLQILLNHSRMRIKKGEITDLSDANTGLILTDEQRQRLKELVAKFPPPKRSGPQIDTRKWQNLKVTKHECEGDSSIRMAYGNTNTVNTYQDFHLAEGSTFQLEFIITHIIFSKKSSVLPEILNQKRSQANEKSVSVSSLTVFHQMHDGGWKECENIAIAPMSVRNEEPRWLTDSIINIQPDKLVSYIIRGCIQIKGNPGLNNSARARLPKSLPQPFKLKIVVTDSTEKQSSLVVEKVDPPLILTTRESFMQEYQSEIKELICFIYADDCEYDERIFLAIYISQKNELMIKGDGIYKSIFDRQGLRALQFHAKQNKITEYEFPEIQCRYNDNITKVTGLFDSETFLFYAIRVELSTLTSKAEETVFIPMEKIE